MTYFLTLHISLGIHSVYTFRIILIRSLGLSLQHHLKGVSILARLPPSSFHCILYLPCANHRPLMQLLLLLLMENYFSILFLSLFLLAKGGAVCVFRR